MATEYKFPLLESINKEAEAESQNHICYLANEQIDCQSVRNVVFRGLILLIRFVEYDGGKLRR